MVVNSDDSNINININNSDTNSHQHTIDGINFRIILPGEHTEGKYSILEAYFPPGSETEVPPHLHSNETLIIYVMEGKFLFIYGKEAKEGSPGMLFKFEKGTVHSYKKIGQEYGNLLLIYVPAGFENFFRDLSKSHMENLKKFGMNDQIMVQLLEKNYGVRMRLNS
jgi:quercetin dioxygenase-like cupin family protein